MIDHQKHKDKALSRIVKKVADAQSHLVKIEDAMDDKKHRTAQHETIKDIRSILSHAVKVDRESDLEIAQKRKQQQADDYLSVSYSQEEEQVMEDLREEFDQLEKKLNQLTAVEGTEIKEYLARKATLEKAKEILQKAGFYDEKKIP